VRHLLARHLADICSIRQHLAERLRSPVDVSTLVPLRARRALSPAAVSDLGVPALLPRHGGDDRFHTPQLPLVRLLTGHILQASPCREQAHEVLE
jgi:hypothetical protein